MGDNMEEIKSTYNYEKLFYNADNLNLYLKEIGNTPKLSLEEENELGHRILKGDKEAVALLAKSNLRLVVSVAKQYFTYNCEFLDLIQEGNIGLMKAATRFDVTKGYRFSTYAVYYIKQSIKTSMLTKNDSVKILVPKHKQIFKYKKAEIKLMFLLNREPTIEEIAHEIGKTPKQTLELYKMQIDLLSLNSKIGSDEVELIDSISAPDDLDVSDIIILKELSNKIKKLFDKAKLSNKELTVLINRFGLNGEAPLSEEALGQQLGVRRESIRQTECRALMKIRTCKYIKNFFVYMDNPNQAKKNIEYLNEEYKKHSNCRKSYFKELTNTRINKK